MRRQSRQVPLEKAFDWSTPSCVIENSIMHKYFIKMFSQTSLLKLQTIIKHDQHYEQDCICNQQTNFKPQAKNY